MSARPWCAGHRWRSRNRALWWAHHAGHRARLLRNQPPPGPGLVYLEAGPDA